LSAAHLATEFADQIIVLFAAQCLEHCQQGFAAGAVVERPVADDLKRGFHGVTEVALGGVGAGKVEANAMVGGVGCQLASSGAVSAPPAGRGGHARHWRGRLPGCSRRTAVGRLRRCGRVASDIDGVELNGLVVRLGLAGVDQFGERFFELAFDHQRGGFLAQVAAGAGRQGDAVEKFTDLTFGQGAVEFIDQLTLKQHLDGWNAADAEVLGEFRVFVGIDLGEMKRPLYSSASFSSRGLSTLHGSHHGAQKSTTTGTVSAGIRTLVSKSSMDVSKANSDMVGPV
jgi:hypothetical protein